MFKTESTRIRTFSYHLHSILFFYKYLQKNCSKRRTQRISTFSYYLYSILFFISITQKNVQNGEHEGFYSSSNGE